MNKLRNIIKGWWLYLNDTEQSIKLRKDRKPICDKCIHKSNINTCNLCGCFLPAKQRVEDEECPMGEW